MAVPNLKLMEAVENLGYRVTVGDVAASTGLNVEETQQGLLALAADVGGHLQVAESGDIAYQFPKNFRMILQSKFWRLRWQKTMQQIGRILFYLVRISFGILLVLSLVLILVAIAVIVISVQSAQDGDSDSSSDRGPSVRFFWFPLDLADWFWFFSPDYSSKQPRQSSDSEMNFLEAIFSFLFGEGNPNADLEQRRWRAIAATIRSRHGAVVAEQLAPYLDDLGKGYDLEYENYLLPVLVRFNGRPEVTPEGGIVYQFPDLQITATEEDEDKKQDSYLKEKKWRFSSASSSQIMWAIGLGAANLIGALVLGSLLSDGTVAAQVGGVVAFVESIYGILLAYGVGFLAIPLGRYLWIGQANQKIEQRNQMRRDRRSLLRHPNAEVQQKLDYAKGLAKKEAIAPDHLAYTTETDILEQDIDRLGDGDRV